MFNQLREIITLKSIQNVEEIFSIRNSTLCHFRGKIHHELPICLHHGPQVDDWEFIVQGNTNSLDFVQLQQTLLLDEDFLRKIFAYIQEVNKVKLNRWRKCKQWKLTILFEVFDEVRLRRKSSKQFVWHDSSLFGSHKSRRIFLLKTHSLVIVKGSIYCDKRACLLLLNFNA